jgi:molecular chaperone HtpG
MKVCVLLYYYFLKVDEYLVNVLFDQTVHSEGGQLKDLAEFIKRMNKLIG